jgi:cytoplasmic iron level regulating protein YaaA (DUF328/UPF0246 family)
MIAILSPAKTIDFKRYGKAAQYSNPIFTEQAFILIEKLREYTPLDLGIMMKINEELSELNFFRNIDWKKEHSIQNSKQAALAFSGIVYQGLKAEDFSEDQFTYANNHLRILSGLYGVLKPLDLIQPYRLEMGMKFNNPRGRDLYSFWGDIITNYFNDEFRERQDNILVNLASKEYFSAIDTKRLDADVITPVFKEYKQGVYKNVTVHAKKARGLMSRYMIQNQISNVEELKNFQEEDYQFNKTLSTEREWVFTR